MRQLAFTTTLLLAALLGCRSRQASQSSGTSDTSSTAPPPPVAVDTTPTVRGFSFDQRQAFSQSIRQQLADADQRIKELAAQVKSRGGAVSDRALANVRATRRAVDRSLKQVDAATAANWEQVKRGVNQSVERLNESIEGAQPK